VDGPPPDVPVIVLQKRTRSSTTEGQR
jgi:hypothetical protein